MSNPPEPSHPPTAPPSLSTAIARQAIVDAKRAVFGYELFDRSQSPNEHSAASDAAMLFHVLSHADHGALIERKTIFINCTHPTLAGGHLELIQPDRAVLEIPLCPKARLRTSRCSRTNWPRYPNGDFDWLSTKVS